MWVSSTQSHPSGPSFRGLLIVFEYSSASELLSILPYVCRAWRRIAANSELWGKLVSRRHPAYRYHGRVSLKEVYFRLEADARKEITIIEGTTLVRYSIPRLQMMKTELNPPFRSVDYAQWVLLPDSRLILAGGYYRDSGWYSNEGFFIVLTGSVKATDKMETKRGNHGMAYGAGRVYCAGGFNGSFLRQVERIDVACNEWRRVGDMTYPRAHFTPTVFSQSLFVAGGSSKVVECMPLCTERFSPLPLSLQHSEFSVILLHSDTTLIAIQKNSVSEWVMKPKRHINPKVGKIGLENWESKMQPTYVGGKAYFLEDLSNSVYEMEMASLKIRQALFRPNCLTFVLNVKAKPPSHPL